MSTFISLSNMIEYSSILSSVTRGVVLISFGSQVEANAFPSHVVDAFIHSAKVTSYHSLLPLPLLPLLPLHIRLSVPIVETHFLSLLVSDHLLFVNDIPHSESTRVHIHLEIH